MYPQSKLVTFYSLHLIIISLAVSVSSMDFSNVKFFELDNSKLVTTSNQNFALTSPKLSTKNWRTVSVNGNEVSIMTTKGEKLVLIKGTTLLEPDKLFIESLRDEIANSNTGYTQATSSNGPNGGGNMLMSSSTGGNGMVSTSFSSSGSFNTMSGGNHRGSFNSNDLSVSMKDESNFWVSKSDLPFNWSRVFINGDLVTLVLRGGDVDMRPISAFDPAQRDAINKLKLEVKEMQKSQTRQMSNTMQHSMDMVSNIFNSIMGNFPKPPSYESGVQKMFGNNFPFGSNNSPFSAASGWPFAGGAFAIAGRRR